MRTTPAFSASGIAPTSVKAAEASSTSTEEVASVASDTVEPLSSSSGLVENVISHLPPALQYGDFAAMGLTGWSPAGIIRWSFELINVSTGLPWFWTIVAGSLFWKLVLLPLSVAGLRNSARLLPLQPQILKAQEQMKKIRETNDKLALQKQALKMKKMYQDAGVSMGVTALTPFVQIPVTLGMFFAVRQMCQLPVPQLHYSGLGILSDLTIPDPYMILPIALCAAVNLQISVSYASLSIAPKV
jgi:YidC/Oxa1 family membrane protein insertase